VPRAFRPETELLIFQRSEGDPLYAEEFVRLISDRGFMLYTGCITAWRRTVLI
jgi:hypothetical protein